MCKHPTCENGICRREVKPKKVYKLNRTPIKKKPCKIKRRSAKRAKEERLYSQRRRKFLIANPVCQYKDCEREATDIHHPEGREGHRLNDLDKCIGLCREHHMIVELNPKKAKEEGYSKSRLVKA